MSEQTENTPEEKEVFKALNCLLLEVDESIVEDIKAKIIKMADAKDASLAALRTERDSHREVLEKIVKEYEALEKLEHPNRPADYVMRSKKWAYIVAKESLEGK